VEFREYTSQFDYRLVTSAVASSKNPSCQSVLMVYDGRQERFLRHFSQVSFYVDCHLYEQEEKRLTSFQPRSVLRLGGLLGQFGLLSRKRPTFGFISRITAALERPLWPKKISRLEA
jgi:hypothetical protein